MYSFSFIIILLLTSQTDSYPFWGSVFPFTDIRRGRQARGQVYTQKIKKLDPELFAFVRGIDYAQSFSRFRLNDVT